MIIEKEGSHYRATQGFESTTGSSHFGAIENLLPLVYDDVEDFSGATYLEGTNNGR